MSSHVYYLSSDGRQYVSLDGDGLWIGTAESLRSREWSYTLGYRSLTGVSRQAREGTVEAAFLSMEIADKLRALADYDMQHKTPGWIVVFAKEEDGREEDGVLVGGWRQRAFITASKPKTITEYFLKSDLTVVLLDGAWLFGNTIPLRDEGAAEFDGLDFPFDFPFDYAVDTSTKYIDNTFTSPAPVKLTFYGAGSNPEVTIGNNTYRVNVTIPDNAFVVADGADYPRTIKLTNQYGDVENIYHTGEKSWGEGSGEYIFEQVPVGNFPVSWKGASAIDLTWYRVEGEIPWS